MKRLIIASSDMWRLKALNEHVALHYSVLQGFDSLDESGNPAFRQWDRLNVKSDMVEFLFLF